MSEEIQSLTTYENQAYRLEVNADNTFTLTIKDQALRPTFIHAAKLIAHNEETIGIQIHDGVYKPTTPSNNALCDYKNGIVRGGISSSIKNAVKFITEKFEEAAKRANTARKNNLHHINIRFEQVAEEKRINEEAVTAYKAYEESKQTNPDAELIPDEVKTHVDNGLEEAPGVVKRA